MSDLRSLQQRLPLPIAPRGGAVGTMVTLSATGLPPGERLLIAFANLQNYQLVQRVETDAEGSFTTTQVVPPWALKDGVHYFFASYADEIPLALSAGFHVTAADGTARVEGTIGAASGGCLDLQDLGETLYHLTGDVGAHKAGDRVTVSGKIAGASLCGGSGITLEVTEIKPLPRFD